jgi:hypothetical protein
VEAILIVWSLVALLIADSIPKMTVFMQESAAWLESHSLCGRLQNPPILSIDPQYCFDLTERLKISVTLLQGISAPHDCSACNIKAPFLAISKCLSKLILCNDGPRLKN